MAGVQCHYSNGESSPLLSKYGLDSVYLNPSRTISFNSEKPIRSVSAKSTIGATYDISFMNNDGAEIYSHDSSYWSPNEVLKTIKIGENEEIVGVYGEN